MTNKKKTTEPSEKKDLLSDIRKFRSIGQKRVGMLFSGGPAPGANAVIATATIQFLNDGWEVIGFYKGYENLAQFDREKPRLFKEGEHFVRLNYDHVTKIRQLGGCLLKTARTNPSKVSGKEIKKMEHLADPAHTGDLYKVLDAMEYLGIQALVSIGGDDTLKTAYYLSLLGVPTVHVPKTIDNDYFGIPWTFGYFTAIERARQEIKVYNQEAYTTDCYFVLELMGRKAGWYTLGAGIAGEAVRMIGPEDYDSGFDLDELVNDLLNMIETRKKNGKNYGVITVSEGLADKLPDDMKAGTVDEHGNLKLSESKIGEILGKTPQRRLPETFWTQTHGQKRNHRVHHPLHRAVRL